MVGWNIRRLRVGRGLSIEELAWKAGIAEGTLAGVERLTLNPTLDTLDKIARALGIRLPELFAPISARPKPLKAGRRKTKRKQRRR